MEGRIRRRKLFGHSPLSTLGSSVSFPFLHFIFHFHMPLKHAQEPQNHKPTVAMALSSLRVFSHRHNDNSYSENGWIACPAAVWMYWMHKSLAQWCKLWIAVAFEVPLILDLWSLHGEWMAPDLSAVRSGFATPRKHTVKFTCFCHRKNVFHLICVSSSGGVKALHFLKCVHNMYMRDMEDRNGFSDLLSLIWQVQ